MRLTELRLENLRNISGADLETDSPFIVVGGDNAAGKTTLLESIHLILAGRSFRTREWSKLISHEKNACMATAKIGSNFVGASRTRGQPPVHRLNGEDVQLSDVAKQFPLQMFDNGIFELFEGAPKYRRQLLDWGLFHVKHDFYNLWRRYNHGLKQRNALLKFQNPGRPDNAQLDVWDAELTETGLFLSSARAEYAALLLEQCSKSELLEDVEINFSYFNGWSDMHSGFEEALKVSRAKDIQYKRTTVGPHHSDLRIKANTKKAGDILSRGQKKLAGFAVKIEQVKMYNAQSNSKCLLLCDDFAAELDTSNQKQIMDCIGTLCGDGGSQVFITAIEPEPILSMLKQPDLAKVFHVKQGRFV